MGFLYSEQGFTIVDPYWLWLVQVRTYAVEGNGTQITQTSADKDSKTSVHPRFSASKIFS